MYLCVEHIWRQSPQARLERFIRGVLSCRCAWAKPVSDAQIMPRSACVAPCVHSTSACAFACCRPARALPRGVPASGPDAPHRVWTVDQARAPSRPKPIAVSTLVSTRTRSMTTHGREASRQRGACMKPGRRAFPRRGLSGARVVVVQALGCPRRSVSLATVSRTMPDMDLSSALTNCIPRTAARVDTYGADSRPGMHAPVRRASESARAGRRRASDRGQNHTARADSRGNLDSGTDIDARGTNVPQTCEAHSQRILPRDSICEAGSQRGPDTACTRMLRRSRRREVP